MALTQYTADTDIIETLGTNPEDRPTLTDDTFKAKFDENAANIKAFLNAMIAELLSTANGKGASQIGIEDSGSKFTAATVEAALAESATLISTNDGKLTTHAALLAAAATLGHFKLGPGMSIDAGGILTSPVMKMGTFTRDVSIASGTQAITGVGFTPRFVLFISGGNSSAEMSVGIQNASAAYCAASQHTITAGTWAMSGSVPIFLIQSASSNYLGLISSWDADGFTISWTKTGLPTGTRSVYYVAIK